MTPVVKEKDNGTVIQELPTTEQAPDLTTFEQELAALCQKYQVQLVPYIITFNNRVQIADAKFMPIEK